MPDGSAPPYVASLISTNLWNAAEWLGVAYFSDLSKFPLLGLVFKDPAMGREIFRQWQKYLGARDAFEVLRVSIIEGDVPGLDSGYSVLVGANVKNLLEFQNAKGDSVDPALLVSIYRLHRMNPAADSRGLAIFKTEHTKHRAFGLVPVTIVNGSPTPDVSLMIEKREIQFVRVEDIRENDPEFALLKRTETAQPKTPRDAVIAPDPTTLIAALEAELSAGRLKGLINEFQVEQLAAVRRTPDGKVDPESIDPCLIVLAQHALTTAVERFALSMSLRDIQQ